MILFENSTANNLSWDGWLISQFGCGEQNIALPEDDGVGYGNGFNGIDNGDGYGSGYGSNYTGIGIDGNGYGSGY